jgi:hypothetical protein
MSRSRYFGGHQPPPPPPPPPPPEEPPPPEPLLEPGALDAELTVLARDDPTLLTKPSVSLQGLFDPEGGSLCRNGAFR